MRERRHASFLWLFVMDVSLRWFMFRRLPGLLEGYDEQQRPMACCVLPDYNLL